MYNNKIQCKSCRDKATTELLIMCEGTENWFKSAMSGMYCYECVKHRIMTAHFNPQYIVQHHRPL